MLTTCLGWFSRSKSTPQFSSVFVSFFSWVAQFGHFNSLVLRKKEPLRGLICNSLHFLANVILGGGGGTVAPRLPEYCLFLVSLWKLFCWSSSNVTPYQFQAQPEPGFRSFPPPKSQARKKTTKKVKQDSNPTPGRTPFPFLDPK